MRLKLETESFYDYLLYYFFQIFFFFAKSNKYIFCFWMKNDPFLFIKNRSEKCIIKTLISKHYKQIEGK